MQGVFFEPILFKIVLALKFYLILNKSKGFKIFMQKKALVCQTGE